MSGASDGMPAQSLKVVIGVSEGRRCCSIVIVILTWFLRAPRMFLETSARDVRLLLSLAESVARRLRDSGQATGMVSTEIKYNTFRKVSHQTTLLSPTSQTDAIYQIACSLFDEIWDGTPVRLLGIRSSKLTSEREPVQMSLFDLDPPPLPQAARYTSPKPPSSRKKEQLEQALDTIRKRYGADAVVRGSLLKERS